MWTLFKKVKNAMTNLKRLAKLEKVGKELEKVGK